MNYRVVLNILGKVLVVEVDNLDYEHSAKDFAGIIDRIDAQLFGLFSKD